MIIDLKTLQEYLDGYMHSFNDTLYLMRADEQEPATRIFLEAALAFHVSLFRELQHTFATMVGTRHLLELEQTGPLSAPDDHFSEIDLAGLKECIPVFRTSLNKLAIKSREIHDLYASLIAEIDKEDNKE